MARLQPDVSALVGVANGHMVQAAFARSEGRRFLFGFVRRRFVAFHGDEGTERMADFRVSGVRRSV
jgi:hypothetical protein